MELLKAWLGERTLIRRMRLRNGQYGAGKQMLMGDGLSNEWEYLADILPRGKASRFEMTIVSDPEQPDRLGIAFWPCLRIVSTESYYEAQQFL